MVQEIRENMDKGNISVGIFVDFQKAFDTVNHKILLRKLEHYGIRGTATMEFEALPHILKNVNNMSQSMVKAQV